MLRCPSVAGFGKCENSVKRRYLYIYEVSQRLVGRDWFANTSVLRDILSIMTILVRLVRPCVHRPAPYRSYNTACFLFKKAILGDFPPFSACFKPPSLDALRCVRRVFACRRVSPACACRRVLMVAPLRVLDLPPTCLHGLRGGRVALYSTVEALVRH